MLYHKLAPKNTPILNIKQFFKLTTFKIIEITILPIVTQFIMIEGLNKVSAIPMMIELATLIGTFGFLSICGNSLLNPYIPIKINPIEKIIHIPIVNLLNFNIKELIPIPTIKQKKASIIEEPKPINAPVLLPFERVFSTMVKFTGPIGIDINTPNIIPFNTIKNILLKKI